MEIKAANWQVNANTLSGGNQQKVVLAKWLATDPKILILDEPTKGIDVATKAAVHEFVSDMAGQGAGGHTGFIRDCPKFSGMSDRIVVMHEGNNHQNLESEMRRTVTTLSWRQPDTKQQERERVNEKETGKDAYRTENSI